MKQRMQWLIPALLVAATFLSQAAYARKQRILFVLTSHDQLGNTGKKTGFWIEEFATPYYFFKDKGIEVVVATPRGGQAPIDPKSNEPAFQTEATKRYFNDQSAQALLSKTFKLSALKAGNFDAVFYPGGHGPMWDLANDAGSMKLILDFYNSKKPLAFVCHGPAALVNVKDQHGQYLLKGKKVSSFCNSEEEAVQLTNVVPFSLESKLRERGAEYVKAADWSAFAVVDGWLVTGQNPQSSQLVAQKLLALLKQPE